MRFFPKPFRKGSPISTNGFSAGIRAMEKALGDASGIGCHVEWSADKRMMIVVDFPYQDDAEVIARPWDLVFSVDGSTHTATFSNCVFKRDSFTKIGTTSGEETGTVTFEMPTVAAATVKFLGFAYNSETHAVEIIAADTLADVLENANPTTDLEIIRTPLYRCIFYTTWLIQTSYRESPSVGGYN